MVCHLRLSGFKGWSAHTVFWLTNTVRVHVALFDIVIVWQLNIRIGIPDKLMLLLGGAAVYHLLLTLSCMTTSLTVPRSCPRKLESTVYAIVSGVTNLGSTCSKMFRKTEVLTFPSKSFNPTAITSVLPTDC